MRITTILRNLLSDFPDFALLSNMVEEVEYDVAVIGLGYVGLPLAISFANSGKRVVGIDTDEKKCEKISSGSSYIKHVSSSKIKDLVENKDFSATTDFSIIKSAKAVVICVPTPLTKNRMPDLSYVESTAKQISPFVQPGQLIVLESTTYPGTTEEILVPTLQSQSKLRAGEDFHIAYSPEREDPGNPKSSLDKIPKVVGGLTTNCSKKAKGLYADIVGDVVEVK